MLVSHQKQKCSKALLLTNVVVRPGIKQHSDHFTEPLKKNVNKFWLHF